MTRLHTLCVYSDNSPGMLLRVTVLFTRRKLNIESLTVSETERPGISRFTVVVDTDADTALKVARQLERIVDVHEAFVCGEDEILESETAMLRVRRESSEIIGASLAAHRLEPVFEDENSVVLRCTGTGAEIDAAVRAMEPHGILEFTRSGRIAMRRDGTRRSEEPVGDSELPELDAEAWI